MNTFEDKDEARDRDSKKRNTKRVPVTVGSLEVKLSELDKKSPKTVAAN